MFRVARLALAATLILSAVLYARHLLFFTVSDQARIHAETIQLRAPIEGQLRLQAIQPGRRLTAGDSVFQVENARYGNREAMSRLAWASDYADRLAMEKSEAEVRHAQQQRIFAIHQNLHDQGLISDLEFLEQQTQWAAARTALITRREQWERAESRRQEAADQLELQKIAAVTMPFDGVPWAVLVRHGQQVAAQEPVVEVLNPDALWVEALFQERHARRLRIGAPVRIRTRDGRHAWTGRVDSIRGAAASSFSSGTASLGAGFGQRSSVAVRIRMTSPCPYGPAEFYGVGRSVVVSLDSHE